MLDWNAILARVIGVVTLKAPTYRQIADDTTATPQALAVFLISTVIAKFFSGIVGVSSSGGGTYFSFGGGIIAVIVGIILGLIALYFTAWVLATVAKALGGKTDTNEMVRVTGYVSVFSLVSVLSIFTLISPALGCLTGLISLVVAILSIIGYVIGVREAAEFSTTNAIITAIVAAVVNFVIVVLIGGAIIGVIVAALSLSH